MQNHRIKSLWDNNTVIKFDFLGIDNLSILKETCRLIKQTTGMTIDPYDLPDGDKKAYLILQQGLVTGIFQMETSSSAKELIRRIAPTSIAELSDVSALNRPGPMSAGLHNMYIDNKNNGYAPQELPEQVANLLKDTYWTLVYQEQVMDMVSKLAGFTLKEADDVRRAMGKKDKDALATYEPKFLQGCKDTGLSEVYALELWKTLIGFADYCLAGNTEVIIWEDGFAELMTIQDIVENKYPASVFSFSVDESGTPMLQLKTVTQWHERGTRPVTKYTLENGKVITCTPDHMFLTKKKQWMRIQDIFEQKEELWLLN